MKSLILALLLTTSLAHAQSADQTKVVHLNDADSNSVMAALSDALKSQASSFDVGALTCQGGLDFNRPSCSVQLKPGAFSFPTKLADVFVTPVSQMIYAARKQLSVQMNAPVQYLADQAIKEVKCDRSSGKAECTVRFGSTGGAI